MSLHQSPGRPTKRGFGLCYLASVAVLLTGGLVGYGLASENPVFGGLVALIVALPLFLTILYVGKTFRDIDVSGELVWRVAQWTALGVAVATLLSFTIGIGHWYVPGADLLSSLIGLTITGGGLSGALIGSVVGLREQHHEVEELNQRNSVLNRVLRHNIKNGINVILGHAALLDDEVTGSSRQSVDAIQRAATDISRLSETARTVDQLGTCPEVHRIDVTRVVRQCVDTTSSFYPDAELTADLPDTAWADASQLLGTVIKNLLTNAIEHHDGDPCVRVSVRRVGANGERVHVAVADDGPGIYDGEREALDGEEDPTDHGSGLGLWLVKWFTRAHDGKLWFEDNEPRGTIVHLTLPAANAADGGSADGRVGASS